jgi:hypothetical protein
MPNGDLQTLMKWDRSTQEAFPGVEVFLVSEDESSQPEALEGVAGVAGVGALGFQKSLETTVTASV